MEQENVISMEQVLTQPACPEHLETQTFYQQEADLVQSDNENCRKKANTGHESRNAWAMADAATCLEDLLEDLLEVTQRGGRETEKK